MLEDISCPGATGKLGTPFPSRRQLAAVLLLAHAVLAGSSPAQSSPPASIDLSRATAQLRARIEASPVLPLHCENFAAKSAAAGWQTGAVSGVAIGKDGNIFEIQRGDKSAPVLVLDPEGNILRSWGAGNYTIPHSIRLDRDGNVWTVDAGSSTIIKYSPAGQRLMTIHVGGQPNNGSPFNGTTDLGFGPDGHVFITDGYGNARVLEYTSGGKQVREWGKPGSGPGEFNLPHSIQIDRGTIYVADRENGRIEMFNLSGHYLGQFANLGRIYSIRVRGDAIWASMGPMDEPPGGAGGWLVRLDRRTGELLGHIDVAETRAGHALDVSDSGEPMITLGDALLRCRSQ